MVHAKNERYEVNFMSDFHQQGSNAQSRRDGMLLAAFVASIGLIVPSLALAADGSGGANAYLQQIAPIAILLTVIAVAIGRLPKVESLGHSGCVFASTVNQLATSWLNLCIFLYMARYNIKVSQHAFGDIMHDGAPLMTNGDFATIFFWGTLTYGFSFLINGPLTDRYGGKMSILLGAAGSAVMNLAMGLVTLQIISGGSMADTFADNLTPVFSVLYAINMYFQSFGAVAIVKCNAPWFHVSERGVFGAIFGILISLGIYFAFDIGYLIIENFELQYVFLIPTILLSVFWVLDLTDRTKYAGTGRF